MHSLGLKRKYDTLLTLFIALLFHALLFFILLLFPLYEKKTAVTQTKNDHVIDLVFDPPTPKVVAELKQGPSSFGENENDRPTINQQNSANHNNISETNTTKPPTEQFIKPEKSQTTSDDITSKAKTILERAPIYDQPTPKAHTKSSETETPPAPKTQPRSPQKTGRSIIEMTRGYLDSIDYGGQDAFNRQGDASIRPDLEDAKWISFKKKIFWEINKSLRFLGILSQSNWHGCSSVQFRLDNHGHASSIQIHAQSGSGPCDKLALKIIKTTSPFSPIPKHLNRSHLDMIIRFRREGNTFVAEMQILNT